MIENFVKFNYLYIKLYWECDIFVLKFGEEGLYFFVWFSYFFMIGNFGNEEWEDNTVFFGNVRVRFKWLCSFNGE